MKVLLGNIISMQFEGKFLGFESLTFDAADGKTIPYYRLHAWVPGTMKYKMLKVSGAVKEAVEASNLNFGDAFICEVEEGATDKGVSFLKIVKW